MDAAELASVYATPHDARRWPDHQVRVRETVAFIRQQVGPVAIAADLSCGNGQIIDGIDAEIRVKGDLAPGYDITGPIEQTLPALGMVDLLICSETLEHLDDPDLVLGLARGRCRTICVTTPAWETTAHNNPEHYWSWGLDDISQMLTAAGFEQQRLLLLPLGFYTFQVWVAS
jgi:hypothetical protein